MSQDDFEALKARMQALEDRNAIIDTLTQYGQALDYGDFDRLVDCFTDDAVRENRRPDGSVHRWEGRAGTIDFASRHSHAPDLYHKHLALNPHIELHGDTANVVSYMFRFDAGDGERSFIWGLGRYLDTMKRDPDGRWRIQHRVSEIEDQWPGRFVLTGFQEKA
ncbi:nuclear transport factor 2 family protein [Amycolatopsis sp. K13G38]|uniref:Nuclear transport factor 2 family protein n=1 Tax=Amycolatopsis acididurans TaxID=2724524 RepID=A0ABX1JDT5_9PSEU|nr:nuclear transport factor 2 family protein [Amycolatopsis acididurans]NKQ57818.1 nuclear transport factor 2 family protein [Amycolatopsis acididurans]